MLFAMGAVVGEQWVASMKRGWRLAVEGVVFCRVGGMGLCWHTASLFRWLRVGRCEQFALKNNGDLREEIGWDEMVRTVAGIRDSLPAEQRSSVGVLVGNYGEQGAVEILGPAYGLPMPISMTNSAWLRGYPAAPPTTLIVRGIFAGGGGEGVYFLPAGRA